MKKQFFVSAFAATALLLNAQNIQSIPASAPMYEGEESSSVSMEFGYCGEFSSPIGWGNVSEVTLRAAIQLPKDIATRFKGAQISKVLAYVCEASYFESSIFITQGLQDEENIYDQEISLTPNCWNEISLTEPYTIDGDEIFVGYQTIAGSTSDTGVGVFAIGVDNKEADPCGDYIGTFSGESWSYMHLSEAGLGNVCIRLVLTGDNLPQYDLELQNITVKENIRTGDEFSIKGSIKNHGAKAIDFYDVQYQIGDNAPVTVTLDSRIEPAGIEEFVIEGIKTEADGKFDVVVTITDLDGHADEDPSNNSLTKTINSLSNLATRKVLLEQFSTAQCSNCPRAHEILETIVGDSDDVAWVVHHAGYGYDTFTADASRKYTAFYGGYTYAPALMLDRTNLAEQGALGSTSAGSVPSSTPIFQVTSENATKKLIDYSLSQPAFVTLNIEETYNAENSELQVRVFGESLIEFSDATFMNVFLTESGMVNYQAGASNANDYVHNHALRTTMTPTWGDEITYNEDGTFEKTYSLNLKSAWNPENMEVVAFISNYNEDDINDCIVHNVEKKKINYSSVESIDNNKCNVWTNGKTVCISGEYKHAEVYAMDGRLVKTIDAAPSFDIENAGIYIIVVDGVTTKIAIK